MFKNWTPVDVIVGMLAVSACFALGLACVGIVAGTIMGEEYNETRGKTVGAAFATLVNIISMFIGAKIQEKADNRTERDDEP